MEIKTGLVLWVNILLLFLTRCSCTDVNRQLKPIYSWKSLEFDFPNEHARDAAIKHGDFKPGAPIPIDVDFYTKEKQGSTVFVTIPRFQDGVPATLGYVTDRTRDGNPVIAPYPNWDWQKAGDCNAMTSVYRVMVDQCDRLWVLDTGKIINHQVCRPQLLVFNLRTNNLIDQYRFPKDQFKDDSLFVTPMVDIRDQGDKCHDTFVYIADVTGFALLVYDQQHKRSWRIDNKLFYPYPPYGTFHIKGDTFDLMDGIFGLALGPMKNGDRTLYYHSLASRVESHVLTSVIRNHTLFRDDSEAVPRAFKAFPLERSSQSGAESMDKNGVLFYGLMSDLAIGCWNSNNYPEYGGTNLEILTVNPETLQFASGLKIVPVQGREELWVLTSSFQKYMTGTLNPNETNFRIQAAFIEELVRGTKCDVASLNIRGGRLSNFSK